MKKKRENYDKNLLDIAAVAYLDKIDDLVIFSVTFYQ